MAGLPYKVLEARHPDHAAHETWERIDDLYFGLDRIERNLDAYLRRRSRESDEEYRVRKTLIDYENAMVATLQRVTSPLFARQDLTVNGLPEDEAFWTEFLDNVDRSRRSLTAYLKGRVLGLLRHGVAWTQVDLPPLGEEMAKLRAERRAQGVDLTEAEVAEAGANRAYLVPLHPKQVLDWNEDEATGALRWAVVRSERVDRAEPQASRDKVRIEWRVLWPDRVELYAVDVEREERTGRVDEGDLADKEVPLIATVPHEAGRVPLARMTAPGFACADDADPGLWLGKRIWPLCRGLLRVVAGRAWNEYLRSHPQEMLKLDDPESFRKANEGDGRARGAEKFLLLRTDEDYAFVEPTGQASADLRESEDRLLAALDRSLNAMAASVSPGKATAQSGLSKTIDQSGLHAVLGELGRLVKEHAEDLIHIAAGMRGEADRMDGVAVSGMTRFDVTDLDARIAQARDLDLALQGSPTARRIVQKKLVGELLPDLGADTMAEIEKEIDAWDPSGPQDVTQMF